MRKRLNAFDLSMIVVSLILGMGIFRTPSSVARDAGTPFIFFSAWIFGAIIAFFGALTFAEIGSRFPRTGGSYKILSEAYNPAFAFMVNWIQVISNAASIGAIMLVGVGYLIPLINLTKNSTFFSCSYLNARSIQNSSVFLTMSLILILYLIGRMGLKMSSRTQNFLSLLKIGMVLMLFSSVFLLTGKPNQYFFGEPVFKQFSVNAFTLSLMGVFFTYEGYQWVINFGGETKEASRTIPRGLIIGLCMILFMYMALNYSFYHIIGFHNLALSSSPASEISEKLFGPWGFFISSLIIFFSISGYAHAGMMSNPRMYIAMAEDGVLPKFFLHENTHSKVKTRVLSLFTFFILISLVFAGSFEKLLEYIILFDNIGLAAAAGSIFIFRNRKIGESEKNLFKLKFYPLIPILFITALALVSYGVALRNWKSAFLSLLLFLLGLPIFHLLKRINR